MSWFWIPKTAEVVITFNGYAKHLEDKKCYRRILGLLLKRHPPQKLAILLKDKALAELVVSAYKLPSTHLACKMVPHYKVGRFSSTLVYRYEDINQAYIFDHSSHAIKQGGEWSDIYWKAFSDH